MPSLPKLDWKTADINTMPANVAKMYKAYRDKVTEAEKLRKTFETATAEYLKKARKVPDGQEPRFAYRWGKLAVAFAEPGTAKTADSGELFTF